MPPASSQPSPALLLALGLATAATCWATQTPSGQAWALRVWEGDREGAKRRKAMKQLRFLEARLAELAAEVEACGRRLDAVEAGGAPEDGEEEHGRAVSAYYHFDSKGNKFKNKWDTYDVDEELARLDAEEQVAAEAAMAAAGGASKQGGGARGKVTLGRVRTEVGQLNHDLERLMGYLDQVRGDEEVKARRKGIVQASHEVFGRLDALTQRLLG